MQTPQESVDTGCAQILASIEPPIGWLTLNNPERRNAVSYEMWLAIPRALAGFQHDSRVRAVVIRGAGDRAFVSGADISQFKRLRSNLDDNKTYRTATSGAYQAIAAVEKPVLAMIRGACMGGGLAVALACDLRIASADSTFAIPAARLGLGYTFEGVDRLLHHVGPTATADLLFTARRIAAREAREMGLINRVVDAEALEADVRAYADMIAENAPLTIRACKLAMTEAMKPAPGRDLSAVSQAIEDCFRSEDYREGQAAFAEKRKPRFRGA